MNEYRSLESTIRNLQKEVPISSSRNINENYHSICNTIKNLVEFNKLERDQNDQLAVGTYMTKNFEMSPDAQRLYDNLPKGTNSNIAELCAIAQDRLFALEKEVYARKNSTPQEVARAEQLQALIMDFAKHMGLEKQHAYINSNVEVVKKYLDSANNMVNDDEIEELIKKRFTAPVNKHTPEPQDVDIDSSNFLQSLNIKMQRKLKIIDND